MTTLDATLFDALNARQHVGTMKTAVFGSGGMTAQQTDALATAIGFALPPDFVFFLQHLRDPGEVFFDYRNFSRPAYDETIARVLDGLIWSFDHDPLWMKRWGSQPADADAAKAIIRRDFPSWPKLLPIYGHRYLAAEPCLAENPVFSIAGPDMVYYGANLADYLTNEFLAWSIEERVHNPPVRRIPVWSDFAEQEQDAFVEAYFKH